VKRINQPNRLQVDDSYENRYYFPLSIAPFWLISNAARLLIFDQSFTDKDHSMGTERQRELRRRRSRSRKVALLATKVKKANKSEKATIAQKLRRMTPGADQIITAWNLKA
jgi:hypothetical protein